MKAKMRRSIVPVTTISAASTTPRSWTTRSDWATLKSLEGPQFPPEREGIDWVRGHDGPVVDAFRVACALRPTT